MRCHSLQPVMKIEQHTKFSSSTYFSKYYILRGVGVLFIEMYGYELGDQQIRTKSRYYILGRGRLALYA
jgi:hypothetical protein